MKTIFKLIAASIVVTLFVPGLALAAPADALPGESGNETAVECTETVTQYLDICGAELDGNELVIELETEGQQNVVLTEAFRKGSGVLNQRTVLLDEGRNTVRLAVTVDGGAEGFTIASGGVLYQREVKADGSLFGGPWTASDAQAAGLGGAISVALVTLLLVLSAVSGRSEGGERVA